MTIDAREIAGTVLVRVWQDRAYAARVLDAELSRRPQLDRRDAALATELVYGVLRTQPALEKSIDEHAKNARYKKQPAVKAPLLIAAYSLQFLDRVPPYAAIDRAVGTIRSARGPKVAGFANAVLRKLAKHGRADLQTAIRRSVPSWLNKELLASLGDVDAFVQSGGVPPIGLCVTDATQRDEWLLRLRSASPNATFELGSLSPHAILVHGAGNLRSLPGHELAWHIQEEGAQLIAIALGARPGERVLDACAGRGGKTRLLAHHVGAQYVVATDVHPRKLNDITGVTSHAVDWSKGSGSVEGPFDRILVDAPCSGTGTLGRRPEIALRLTPKDVKRLAALQLRIATNAAKLLRTGGSLLYAVCSVLRTEAEDVVTTLCRDASLVAQPFEAEALRRITSESQLRLLPNEHHCDGYYLALLTRT